MTTTGTDANPPYVFLSYASADRDQALAIADAVDREGVGVWVDRRDIAGGTNWDAEIVRALRSAAAVLLVVTRSSVLSPNVLQELRIAWEEQRPIVPLLLERVTYPDDVRYVLAGRQWVELFEGDIDPNLPSLLSALSQLGIHPAALPPTNLAATVSTFVGRERELAETERLLSSSRLLTLTGVGGTGKTSLALALARRSLRRYDDGVFFVDLSPIADPALVLPTAARVLGVRESDGQAIDAAVIDHFADKRALLVLDNFEHVIQAAEDVGRLLSECPRLTVLVTSRTPLRLSGEHEFPVPPLAVPRSSTAPLDAIASSAAVALFVDRARSVRPGFSLDAENARHVAELCVQLDGSPLAIELAAARIRVLSPQAISERLGERLGLLTGGFRGAPERQRTLRGAIQWSYDLLRPDDQAVFRRLSVFAGGWTLAAARAVCGAEAQTELDMLDALTSLAEQNLVRHAEGHNGEPRFTMLETLRQYGDERLSSSGELVDSLARHCEYFARLAEAASPTLLGPQQDEWLKTLEHEHDNLRKALSGSTATESGRAGGLLRIAPAIWRFWLVHGHLTEGRRWLSDALSRAGEATPVQRAKALHGSGALAWAQGDYGMARPLLEEALDLAQRLQDEAAEASILIVLGVVTHGQGDDSTAKLFYERGLSVAERIGADADASRALSNLGVLAHLGGDFAEARLRYLQAETTQRALGHQAQLTLTLANLGAIAVTERDWNEAEVRHREALELAHHLSYKHVIAASLEGLAAVSASAGGGERAARLLGAADGLRAAIAAPVSDEESDEYERALALAKMATTEEAFAAAWAEGHQLDVEAAVALALRVV